MRAMRAIPLLYSEYKREGGFHTIEYNLKKEIPGLWRITGYKRFNKKVYRVYHNIQGNWVLKLEGVKYINEIPGLIKEKYPEYYL